MGGGGGDGEAILVVIAVMQFSDDNDGIEPTVPASPSSNAATTPNRSACDPDEWQQKADTYIEDNELTANWADPDGEATSSLGPRAANRSPARYAMASTDRGS